MLKNVSMRDHHPFGCVCRSRGVLEVGDFRYGRFRNFAWMDLTSTSRTNRDRVDPAEFTGASEALGFQGLDPFRIGQDQGRPRVVEDTLETRQGPLEANAVGRRSGNRYDPGSKSPKERGKEVEARGKKEESSITRTRLISNRGGHGSSPSFELAIRERFRLFAAIAAERESGSIEPFTTPLDQELIEVGRRRDCLAARERRGR